MLISITFGVRRGEQGLDTYFSQVLTYLLKYTTRQYLSEKNTLPETYQNIY